MREFELRLPVCLWMLEQGLTPIMEMQSVGNCDMVGVTFTGKKLTRIVAVELKLKNRAAVIRQAKSHVWRAHETYCAMPFENATNWQPFRMAGVGLLCITDGVCHRSIVSPQYQPEFPERIQRTAWRRREEYKIRMQHPMMKKLPAETSFCRDCGHTLGRAHAVWCRKFKSERIKP